MKNLFMVVAALMLGACGPAVVEEPELALEQSASELAGCTVSHDCGSGISISCSGTYCSSGPGYVDCDGVRKACPPTSCTINGVTYAHGATNPYNSCQVCDVTRSTTSWSNNSTYNGGGYCKSTTRRCIGGPCADSFCSTSSDCTATCVNGAPVCDGGL